MNFSEALAKYRIIYDQMLSGELTHEAASEQIAALKAEATKNGFIFNPSPEMFAGTEDEASEEEEEPSSSSEDYEYGDYSYDDDDEKSDS